LNTNTNVLLVFTQIVYVYVAQCAMLRLHFVKFTVLLKLRNVFPSWSHP